MKSIEIAFPKLNHFWLDSGLLGLAVILKEVDSNIERTVSDKGLTLKGTETEIREAMEKAYDLLIERYYDTSTKKQRDDTKAYNFYYDSNEDKFIAFPKKKAVGIADLIYNKAPRPVGSSVKWKKKIKEKKVDEEWIEMKEDEKVQKGQETRKRYILPNSHANLQKRMDEFLNKHGLDVTTTGLLIDGPNTVQPKVNMPKKFFGETKGQCYLCGEDGISLEGAGQTIFPFITGSSGLLNFNTLCSKPEKICWKCAFIGKFVPVNGFYLKQGGDLFAFFPYSVSFEKMLDVYSPFLDAKYEDPHLFKNFKHPLGFEKNEGGWFQKPFEVAFAFLYTLYRKVLLRQMAEEEAGMLNWEEMCNLTISKAPLEFVILHAESKGQTAMGKMVWQFRDSVYFFRLMELLERTEISVKEVMRLLIDFSQKNDNKTLIRNKVCERILKKKSIIDLIESYVFSIDAHFIKPLVEFTIKYEPIIREEGNAMTIDAQDAAVTLGKRIGMTVAENGKRGDLYALRKARRKTDFLSELNRLQFKCKLVVPPPTYEGMLTDSNFVEFKQFCMIAALNSFYAATHSK
jgi:hypothetical protein